MSVDPLQSHNVGPSTDAAPAARRGMPDSDRKPAAGAACSAEDTVDLSDASGSPVEQAGERAEAPPYGTISADRLREVVERLESNFYDRPEVRDRIARGMARDLGPQRTE